MQRAVFLVVTDRTALTVMAELAVTAGMAVPVQTGRQVQLPILTAVLVAMAVPMAWAVVGALRAVHLELRARTALMATVVLALMVAMPFPPQYLALMGAMAVLAAMAVALTVPAMRAQAVQVVRVATVPPVLMA